ncbi:MAG: ATPase domain-containing protein [Candidatus Aenigmatarchaeota archaeon]
MNKISSGVSGLDEILGGGIPERYILLVSGTCGAGKTIMGLQFLLSSNEPGIYVSFEEEEDGIRETAKIFGWDIVKREAANKFRILKYDPFRLEDILEVIENNIREIGAKRVVFDSVAALGIYLKDASELRRMILQIDKIMKKNKCTTIIISEIVPGSTALSRFGVEEFVSDGVIILDNINVKGEYKRAATIWKMRGVNHSKRMHPYDITNRGIVINPRTVFVKSG